MLKRILAGVVALASVAVLGVSHAEKLFPEPVTIQIPWATWRPTFAADSLQASFATPGTAAVVESTTVIDTRSWFIRAVNLTGAATAAQPIAILRLVSSSGANADTVFYFPECSPDGGSGANWLANTTAVNTLRVSGANSTSFVAEMPLYVDPDVAATANLHNLDMCPFIRVRIRGDANTYLGGAKLYLTYFKNPEQ